MYVQRGEPLRILYIFPHPDDESFGPAAVIHQQLAEGHEVYLFTLTRGGATKQRHKLGVSIEEMGKIRLAEMHHMEVVLGLSGMTVWDLPDGKLQDIDPRELEFFIQAEIERLRPEVVVTYPVHGISGFHDHLVTHAIVKRVYLQMRDQGEHWLRRLAFFTIPDNGQSVFQPTGLRIKQSDEDRIDVEISLKQANIDKLQKCLSCYTTYQDTIAHSGVIDQIGNTVYFELYSENFNPRLSTLTERIKE